MGAVRSPVIAFKLLSRLVPAKFDLVRGGEAGELHAGGQIQQFGKFVAFNKMNVKLAREFRAIF